MLQKIKEYYINHKKIIWLSLASFAVLLCMIGILLPAFHKSPAENNAQTEQSFAEHEANEDADDENYLFTVCLDAGHGGKDNGSDYKGRIEKHDCVKIAKAVREELENAGVRVLMTREDDSTLTLADRCYVANENNADYMVSIHRNKGKGYGVETWISKNASAESMALAQNVMEGLGSVGISRDRGVKIGSQSSKNEDYYINRHSQMPSCLIELGFINSTDDNADFDQHVSAYAASISQSILSTYDLFHTQNLQEQYITEHAISDLNALIPVTYLSESVETEESSERSNTEASGETSDKESTKEDSKEAGEIAALFGKKLRTTHVPEDTLLSLDTTNIEYMQGSQTADRNRPSLSLEYQATYQPYQASFIGTDALMTEDGKKILYLTFNQRYEYGYTEHVLDVLKEKEIPATFFVTLPYAKENPRLLRRMLNEGHVLGNLGSTNPSDGLPSLSLDQQKHEILANHTYIKKQYHYYMTLFRFPAGRFSEQSLAVVNNANYQSIFFSFAYTDYDREHQPDPADSLNKLIAKLHPGGIYMLRGESETNSTVLEEFLDEALDLGYTFCLLP